MVVILSCFRIYSGKGICATVIECHFTVYMYLNIKVNFIFYSLSFYLANDYQICCCFDNDCAFILLFSISDNTCTCIGNGFCLGFFLIHRPTVTSS